MSNFRLTGYRRRIVRKVFDVAGPRWPEFSTDIRPDVLDDLEGLIRGYPPFIRFGIVFMLFMLEFGGPITFTGLVPFTFLSDEAAQRRFRRLMHHRVPAVRNIPKFLKIIVSIASYGRPEVEEFLGAPRRRWRAERQRFREKLVQIDASRSVPEVPAPLGHASARETYLDLHGDSTRVSSTGSSSEESTP